MITLTLKPGRERALRRRHPWIFANALDDPPGDAPAPGDTVTVAGHNGEVYGQGAYSPASQLRVRMWHFQPGVDVDRDFFAARLAAAGRLRERVLGAGIDGYRLVNAESDGLPGLIIDRYGQVLVCQFLSAGPERWRDTLVALLVETFPGCSVYERSDVDIRKREALAPRSGLLAGPEPPEMVSIREHDWVFRVDPRQGQKTGFYLDQRDSRRALAAYCDGAEVLNAFSYTGGFAVAALAGGARRVTNIDSSAGALGLGLANLADNGLDPARVENLQGDAFRLLRQCRQQGRRFDVVVLDPPKFLEHKAQLKRASRGYKDLNLQAFGLLRRGGLLFSFSCSGLLEPALFQKIVADAALDAGRTGCLIDRLSQAADHPTDLAFPEGHYLKGLVVQVA